MHDDDIRGRLLEALLRDPKVGEVVINARYTVEIGYSLALNPQSHDDVSVAQAVIKIIHDFRIRHFVRIRCERPRRNQPYFARPQRVQPLYCRSSNPGMRNVTNNGNCEIGKIAKSLPNRQQIEQTLCRM